MKKSAKTMPKPVPVETRELVAIRHDGKWRIMTDGSGYVVEQHGGRSPEGWDRWQFVEWMRDRHEAFATARITDHWEEGGEL